MNTLSFLCVLSNYTLNEFKEILSLTMHIPKKHKANHAFKTKLYYFIFIHPFCWKSLENANRFKTKCPTSFNSSVHLNPIESFLTISEARSILGTEIKTQPY